MAQTRVALLDWDGTLRKPFTILSWYRYLSYNHGTNGMVDPRELEELYDRYRIGKFAAGYHQFAVELVDLYGLGMEGVEVAKIEDLVHGYPTPAISRNLYDISHHLVTVLIQLDIDALVITGSPEEAVQAEVAHHSLGWRVRGTELDVSDGIYLRTATNRALAEKKKEIVEEEMANGAEVIIAFGDTNSDAPLMIASGVRVVEALGWTPHAYLATNSGSEQVQEAIERALAAAS